MSLINKFKGLMTEAHNVINVQEAAKEHEKIGTLRAGSSGAIVDGKVYAAQCGRLAQARLLGKQSDPTEEMRTMFVGGLALEQFLEERLKERMHNKSIYFYEKEQTITAEIHPGIVISGRPDFLVDIRKEEWEVPEVIGIEVKSLASPFSVIKQRKNKAPLMKHLIQAATYMTILNHSKWLIMIGHTFNVNQNGIKVPSEVVWYEVSYVYDYFSVTNEDNETYSLPFTKAHIIDYYKEVLTATNEKRLMARPKEYELNIDNYDRCKYCPMEKACRKYDDKQLDFETWLGMVSTATRK